MTPATSILLFNLLVILLFYGFAIKHLAIRTLRALAIADVFVVTLVCIAVGLKYHGTPIEIWGTEWHWLLFTILSYSVIEAPFGWYQFKKYQ